MISDCEVGQLIVDVGVVALGVQQRRVFITLIDDSDVVFGLGDTVLQGTTSGPVQVLVNIIRPLDTDVVVPLRWVTHLRDTGRKESCAEDEKEVIAMYVLRI